MKIAIIGSTALKDKMLAHKARLEAEGHEVRLPVFDDDCPDVLRLAGYNLENILWAEAVHSFWDCRSGGFIFDFGMCFALRKPLKPIFMEQKTFESLIKAYAHFHYGSEGKNETT